jgi:hypothetical protein
LGKAIPIFRVARDGCMKKKSRLVAEFSPDQFVDCARGAGEVQKWLWVGDMSSTTLIA